MAYRFDGEGELEKGELVVVRGGNAGLCPSTAVALYFLNLYFDLPFNVHFNLPFDFEAVPAQQTRGT